ncbi:G2/mitotic-specific cyclin-B2 [Sitophilus oryzae]|uniref:G2/mitotic-specific cyclin-B2 n=1 Tax=Sitophilus oryzae TaxID=7048 RepID=A0A6J2YN23_SITOR|nr:G2/mitotic-specific cyclin-B2 [Sitophilus oryzae]XP_030764227.1 G2/mitotic-specific cyclin-B2 [Sitophilus oryzae]
MNSRLPQTVSLIDSNQENARIKAKAAHVNITQPTRRGALGDVGNTLTDTRNGKKTEKTFMGPPVQPPAKNNFDLTKIKVAATSNKDTTLKSTKENVDANKKKVLQTKPVRQESIILKKSSIVQVQTKAPEVIKTKQSQNVKNATIYDPDEKTKDDPLMVTQYTQDILAYLRSLEDQFPIKEKFLEDAKVTSRMRATLVNWLVEIHLNLSLELDTLYLSVTLIDRYLQVNKAVNRSIFQLVGSTALFLACKIEELQLPEVSDFVYIADNAFNRKQLLQMEVDMVRRLDFRMSWPLPIYFLRRYSKIAQVKSDQYNLSKYILELALLDYSVAHVKPSIQAAAACCLAMAITNEVMDASKVWTPTLVHYTTYHYSDFKSVAYEFARIIVKAQTSKFDTVKQKYSKSKFEKISLNFRLNGPLIRKMTLGPVFK